MLTDIEIAQQCRMRPITEIATDMTMICFVTPDVEFSAGNGRVQFFSTMKALSAAVPANSAAYWAGNAFFSRDDRPKTLAVVSAPSAFSGKIGVPVKPN